MPLFLLLLLQHLPLVHAAPPCDVDGDGYQRSGGTCTPGYAVDCNDTLLGGALVNPNQTEVTGDAVDQDCNGADASQQRLKFDMTSTDWTSAGSVLWTGDAASIHPGGSVTTSGGPWQYMKGRMHVIVDVDSASNGCSLTVVNSALVGTPKTITMAIPSGAGTRDFDLGISANHVPAPRYIHSIKVSCSAGGDAIIDFLTVQDGPDVLPPADDVAIQWGDMDMPGGGYETTVVRSDYTAAAWWMGSDVAGVALKVGTDSFQQANGNGTDRFITNNEYAVFDILPMDGQTLAITKGGVLETDDAGISWYHAEDGWPDGGDDDAVDLSVDGRAHVCTSKAYGGGRYAVENLSSDGGISAFIASTAPGDGGVYVRDIAGAGAASYSAFASDLPVVGTAPSYIGALEYIEPTDGPPTLIVGYRGDDSLLPTLYACDVSAVPAVCDPVAGSENLDIRDIQIDTSDPDQDTFFVANNGLTKDHATASCVQAAKTIEEITYTPSGGWEWAATVSDTAIETSTSAFGLTGLTMDPSGSYLFAVLLDGAGSAYESKTGLFRIPSADIGTGTWEDLTGSAEADRTDRDANVTNSDWFGEDQSPGVEARPHVADSTSADFIDGAFDGDTLLLSGEGNVQRVTGMLGTGAFDPENDTSWDFLPASHTGYTGDFQTSVPAEIAVDPSGGLWQATADLGLMYAAPGGYPTGLDCIFQDVGDGGTGVSATSDGTIWFAGHYQGSGNPQQSAIFRSTGALDAEGGLTWCYQSASWSSPFRTDGAYANTDPAPHIGYLVCRYDQQVDSDGDSIPDNDADNGLRDGARYAVPCDDNSTTSTHGTALGGGAAWGNVVDVVGVTSLVAIAKFQSYSATAGRLAYTVNGGADWFNIDFSSMVTAGCNESNFYNNTRGIAAIGMGRSGHTTATADGSDSDTNADSWSFDLAIPGDSTSATCSLALLKFSSTSPTPVWTPVGLTAHAGGCRIDDQRLLGAVASPTRNLLYLYGTWGNVVAENYGGICSIDLTSPSTAPEVVLSPSDTAGLPYSHYTGPIRAVSPDPNIADALFVAVGQDDDECRGGYPCDFPSPLLLERKESGGTWSWSASPLETDELQKLYGLDVLYQYGSTGGTLWYAGAGTYKGQVSW